MIEDDAGIRQLRPERPGGTDESRRQSEKSVGRGWSGENVSGMIVHGVSIVDTFEHLGSVYTHGLIGRLNIELIAVVGVALIKVIESVESGVADSRADHGFAGSYRSRQLTHRP